MGQGVQSTWYLADVPCEQTVVFA